MANTSKQQRESMDLTKRAASKKAKVGDLLARAQGQAKGGAAVYQHNQTDLEFLRAETIKGGFDASKNEVAIETLEIAHVGIKPR
jgi:hypothetical protein